MTTRTLNSPPAILPLYARAAAPLIPGASLLPFIPGRGGEIPETELVLPGVRPDAEAVAAYARVCGFSLRNHLPPTYPQVLAFPLQMAVMADGRFPFGAVGLVHVGNRIVQHRPLGLDEELTLRVRPTELRPHPRGKTFGLVTEAWSGSQKAWESVSTMLRRDSGKASGSKERKDSDEDETGLTVNAEWRLGGDLGRRYGAVSGDRNPIHMHSLTARPLGFPSTIAHGMWTKARCLAALESRLPDAFAVEVRFRKPILLPARVELLSDTGGEQIHFSVRDAKRHIPHLYGTIEPVEAKSDPGRKSK